MDGKDEYMYNKMKSRRFTHGRVANEGKLADAFSTALLVTTVYSDTSRWTGQAARLTPTSTSRATVEMLSTS